MEENFFFLSTQTSQSNGILKDNIRNILIDTHPAGSYGFVCSFLEISKLSWVFGMWKIHLIYSW